MRGGLRSAAEFTLVELITVMLLLSIILGALATSLTSAIAGEERAFVRATAE